MARIAWSPRPLLTLPMRVGYQVSPACASVKSPHVLYRVLSNFLGRRDVDVVRVDQALLPRAGEVHADARPAGAAELPPGRVQLGRLRQVAGLGHPLAVGEPEAGAGAGKAQADLAAGLQVV